LAAGPERADEGVGPDVGATANWVTTNEARTGHVLRFTLNV